MHGQPHASIACFEVDIESHLKRVCSKGDRKHPADLELQKCRKWELYKGVATLATVSILYRAMET